MENFVDLGYRLSVIIPFCILMVGVVILAISLILWIFRLDGFVFLTFGTIMFVIGVIGLGVNTAPYDSKYHKIYSVEGEVTSVISVLVENDGNLTRNPVVELDTVDRPLLIKDSRANKLYGEDIKLTCTIEWVYKAADRYNCAIGN